MQADESQFLSRFRAKKTATTVLDNIKSCSGISSFGLHQSIKFQVVEFAVLSQRTKACVKLICFVGSLYCLSKGINLEQFVLSRFKIASKLCSCCVKIIVFSCVRQLAKKFSDALSSLV